MAIFGIKHFLRTRKRQAKIESYEVIYLSIHEFIYFCRARGQRVSQLESPAPMNAPKNAHRNSHHQNQSRPSEYGAKACCFICLKFILCGSSCNKILKFCEVFAKTHWNFILKISKWNFILKNKKKVY
jgi:hypothetical protein